MYWLSQKCGNKAQLNVETLLISLFSQIFTF